MIPRSLVTVIGAAALVILLAPGATSSPRVTQLTRDDVSAAAPASTCGTETDSTATLQAWIDSAPANSTLTMPQGGCWNVNGTITVESTTGLTINANGSTFMQPTAPEAGAPILQLWLDSNLTIKNLKVQGALNPAGSDGGASDEGDYGVEMEADTDVVLSGISMNDIQGDFIYLSPPYDVDTVSDALNKNIWITGSTFQNGGYHGVSIESVDGLVIYDDTFTNVDFDAFDLEYDDYSTAFNTNGTPYWAAQDNIAILDSTWTNWGGGDWFVSDQGQSPGVQEQNVTISGNTLDGNGPLFELVGTPTYSVPVVNGKPQVQYLNIYLTITNNKMSTGAYAEPYRGGSTPAMSIYSVAGLIMENNDFPLCPGTYGSPPTTQCLGAPDAYVMDIYNITFGVIEHNNFSGAIGVVEPQSYDRNDAFVAECGNTYGVNGSQVDASCS